MDYFFQEQRWTDTFLSLHVKKFKRIILFLLIAFSVAGTKAADVPTSWKDVAFNENIRYSQWVINSRIRDFYGNTTKRGFNTYDENGNKLLDSEGTQAFDYVPGLVAKAILEAYANYKAFDWSKPWFYSVMNYAKDNKYTLVAKSGVTDFSKITLDNMNACKMYFPLMETGALSDGAKSTGETAITNVLTDMKKYNELYVIGNGSASGVKNSTNATVRSMFGGWFHKPTYTDQMWCDGLYMGAALLAQIVNYKNSTTNVDGTSDWDLITKQFTISWNQLYNSEKGLLYHAFTANPKDNASSAWAGISNTSGSEVYHSAAFWGRAMGWYFLALVDVLEQMPSNNSNRATLIGYLEQLAAGLAKYQNGTSGCWYQVVDEKDESLTGNYLESSCTSLFAAAYLKAVRLGFLTTNGTYNYKTIGVNAFKGAVNQFMKYDTFEPTGTTVQLVHNCASAGLGGDKKRSGSREYYITGNDVGQTNTYTEGKVMGAFIMAATEYERANEKDIRFSYDLAPEYTLAQGGSIKAEALGSGTISYQWCNYSDDSEVSGANSATFTPEKSGTYYCKATSGSTTIKTSTTAVTVEGTDGIENGGSETGQSSATEEFDLTNLSPTTPPLTVTRTYFKLTTNNKGSYESGYKFSSGSEVSISLNEGKTANVTKVQFVHAAGKSCLKLGETSGTVTSDSPAGEYFEITSSNNLPLTFSRSNNTTLTKVIVTYTTGTPSTPTTHTVTATAVNGNVTISDGSNTITSGSQVEHGKSLTFTATPNQGYEFSSWSVTGTQGTADGATYTIASLTEATTVTANFTETSSGGGESGGSGTGTVIYFPSGKTSSNEDVLTVSSGNAKSGLSVSYGGQTYTNGVKMESSTKIYLNLDVESAVTFVFDKPNKQFKVSGTTYTTGQDGTFTITLGAETHTISKVDTDVNLVAVEVKSSGSSILFTTHPQDADYVTSTTATAKELTVEAQVNNFTGDAPTIKYQWYKNTTTNSTDGGQEIPNETNTSYTPIISTAGTTYYYCKATATVGGNTLEAYSNIATVTVSDPAITIVTQPVGATYRQNQTGVEKLIVVATTNTDNKITYQWYSNNSNSTAGATKIEQNADLAEYKPSVTAVGKKYYYCEVTSGDLKKFTDIVAITVEENVQPIYGYKVSKAALTAPDINSSKYITTTSDETGKTGEKLVKMTFGGWKWNGGKYKKPGSDTEIADTWKASETVSGVTVLDGYQYWFSGTQDAKHEKKDSVSTMYGETRYGWFVSPKRENGITTDSYPYTLPVRGSFMTFEPTKNGTLTIYILQNGAWNTFDKDTKLDGVSYKKGDIKPGEFRMHAFQITNQRGLVLAEFAPKYSVTNNQKVEAGYSCTKCLDSEKPSTFDKTSTDVSNWEEFWELTQAERQAVKENWSVESNGGCQKIIKLENGSFLAIQKAVVKYQFHVTGNETYYLFSNFSKMGFSGATFQPDAEQPTATPAEGKISTLELSDVTAYNEIKATPKNSNIEGTELKDYTYKIGGTEIAPVAGVYIPQFYSITLKRTFKPNQWTTLSLPFNLTQTEVEQIFGKGTQIIVFDKAEPTSARIYLTFFYHEIQNVLPGYPYLIRPTLEYDNNNSSSADNAPIHTITNGNLTEFTVYNKAINPAIKQHEFKSGDYTAKCTPSYCAPGVNNTNYSILYGEDDIFVSEKDGTVYISEGKSYGKGYRSYIEYTGTTPPSAKALSISFSGVEDGDDNGTTTEIRVTELADDVIETLGIGGVYNLNGQKVADTTRNLPAGIYIVNGRKVVVK